jgi:aerobic-type carbon monoxide dehydrogenase small subunit (CoxS/CutS family)
MSWRAEPTPAGNPTPDADAVDDHLEGNICRCGTYVEIHNAIAAAAARKANG